MSAAPVLPDGLVPDALLEAFGGRVPERELALWAGMTSEGRARALARLSADRKSVV